MLPNHPNLLLENALDQLSQKLLSDQQQQFEAFKQQYEQDNQALKNLANLLEVAMNTLEQSPIGEKNNTPVTNTQLDNLLEQNQLLAEQYLNQHQENQRTIQALTNQVSQLDQSNQALQTQTQQLQQSNQQLSAQNQAILAKLSEWVTLYQAQDAKMTTLIKQLS